MNCKCFENKNQTTKLFDRLRQRNLLTNSKNITSQYERIFLLPLPEAVSFR